MADSLSALPSESLYSERIRSSRTWGNISENAELFLVQTPIRELQVKMNLTRKQNEYSIVGVKALMAKKNSCVYLSSKVLNSSLVTIARQERTTKNELGLA